MAKPDDTLKRWKNENGIRPEEDLDEVVKVLKMLNFEIRTGTRGSHFIHASHNKLTRLNYSELGLRNELTLPTVNGKKVKKVYVKKLMKYIRLLEAENE